ncbi:glycoside hydrolase family 172 protein [Alloacidobacterium sp.]|uniref:glycoside hydrolase family 172 protein n=1 Tax=Alloacidobacterium sp. TaxID=2951999 RepID=UPI002D36040E|nr:glycoside hydrolase family 172 protein [Alloacidobacterium sp.]HYK36559.1 glycoside hydrolase family 172 protein [Alloacidobacterium sp.]
MRLIFTILVLGASATVAFAQAPPWQPDVTQQQTYTLHRESSTDPTGGNSDWKTVAPGATQTVLDVDGPGIVSHIWFTIADPEAYHLKRIVLRMYWDGESTPSVEAPIGDFFGLGLGTYHNWESEMLSVGSDKALNCFFPMPFERHARITVTNEGAHPINALYYNIDYRKLASKLPANTLYFHAQYRQAQPNHGWSNDWKDNGDKIVLDKKNLDGKDNYVWMEATGHGQYVGVTMSVLQNQDFWWGEGDDMFFIDGATTPQIVGTGSEDYFLGAWDFGGKPFSYQLYGAPVLENELAGARASVYRFHLDSPIPFQKSFKATIEHGHANARSDNYYSVAYWYQAEPHAAFPPLPPVEERQPALQFVGGPGNGSGTAKQ